MNRELLEEYIKDGMSSYDIAREVNLGQTTIRYWIKKHGLQLSRKKRDPSYCPKCNSHKEPSEFYQYGPKRCGYCKSCLSAVVAERARRIKSQAVEYAGGCCSVCGYDRYIGALEFHHRDPTEKDFAISNTMLSFDNIRSEIDKCALLCSNCHREVHAGLVDIGGSSGS